MEPPPPVSPSPIDKRHGAYLPHWTRDGATYAVTMRLFDALPAEVVAQWRAERDHIVRHAAALGRELTEFEHQRLAELREKRIEEHLDRGAGACFMRDPRVADVVEQALLHFNGHRYEIIAWCVMPNHAHAVFRPLGDWCLSSILHSWKSFTANAANRLLGRTGDFWQSESYDHLARGPEDLANQVRYVLENPAKAGLRAWRWVGCRGRSQS